ALVVALRVGQRRQRRLARYVKLNDARLRCWLARATWARRSRRPYVDINNIVLQLELDLWLFNVAVGLGHLGGGGRWQAPGGYLDRPAQRVLDCLGDLTDLALGDLGVKQYESDAGSARLCSLSHCVPPIGRS